MSVLKAAPGIETIRQVGGLSAMIALSGLFAPAELRAPAGRTKVGGAEVAPAETTPLGKYVPKDNLIFYVEFEGLSAHAASWEKRPPTRCSTRRPWGSCSKRYAGQLLDKAMAFVPNRRLSGPEIVTLVKGAAKSGWVLRHPTSIPRARPCRADFCPARGRQQRAQADLEQADGLADGDRCEVQDRTEGSADHGGCARRHGPMLPAGAQLGLGLVAREKRPGGGRPYPAGADAIIAALDGKAPAPSITLLSQELKKPEGTFEPVCVAFVDTAGCPDLPTKVTDLSYVALEGRAGINRIDLRLGFRRRCA